MGSVCCYAVLWIPTIFYCGAYEDIKRFSAETNISDFPDDEYYVKVELMKNGDVQVYTKQQQEYVPFVLLERKAESSNGLLMFSYEPVGTERKFRFTADEFPSAVYHLIKCLYHTHDFHKKEEDSPLRPYITTKFIDVQKNDNPALLHYLQSYCTVIRNNVTYLQLAIGKVRKNIEDGVSPENRRRIQERCLRIRGFEVYMGVLYRSKYNTKCRTDNMRNRKWRHMACDIENGIRFARTVEKEFGDYIEDVFEAKVVEDAKNSVKGSNISIILSIVSVIAALVSIYIAYRLSWTSAEQLENATRSLMEKIDKSQLPDGVFSIVEDSVSIESHSDSAIALPAQATDSACSSVLKDTLTLEHSPL